VPLAEFWADLTQLDSVGRGLQLTQAFLTGHPILEAAGFGPFYTALNFTVGTGQIRTNNFDTGIWTLREFKLAAAEGDVAAIPFPTAEAPHGALWNDTADLPQGPGCREAFINESLAGVLGNDPAQFSFIVPQECKDAESQNDFSQDYASQLSNGSIGGFRADLQDALAGTNLTPEDIATRAQFAGSCIGCHNEASGAFLGAGTDGDEDFAPFSNDFVHVQEFTEDCPDGEGQCHALSPAVVDLFLPHRLQVMENLVSVPMPQQCGSGGGDGGVIFPPPPPFDGGVIVFPDFDSGAVDAGAAFEVELPAADTPTVELLAEDEEARDAYGSTTIGGQSARQTH
jgi:hypothetical protein